jgi:hypothetical protein
MKLQFRTSALLLTVAFVSIALGGGLADWRLYRAQYPQEPAWGLAVALVYTSPYWMPLICAAYALGRGKLTARAVMAFAALEAAGFGGMAIVNYYFN